MNKEEKEYHRACVDVAISHPICDHAKDVLLLNLKQIVVDDMSANEAKLLAYVVFQFARTIAIVSRLQALDIDPESMRATRAEISEGLRTITQHIPCAIPVVIERGPGPEIIS